MVWGMNLPSGFGEFWPLGDFEFDMETKKSVWRERLSSYYQAQPSEAQKALYSREGAVETAGYPYYVASKFIREMGTRDGPSGPPLGAIEEHEPPLSFDAHHLKYRKKLGSLIMLNDRILAVDAALKGIIERLEPSVHQFFPLKITSLGEFDGLQYYTLVIGQYLDSFSPEQSEKEACEKIGDHRYRQRETKAGVTGLAFSKAAFGKAHVWRERSFREWLICLSDELQSEIAQAGLRMPKHYRMKEV